MTKESLCVFTYLQYNTRSKRKCEPNTLQRIVLAFQTTTSLLVGIHCLVMLVATTVVVRTITVIAQSDRLLLYLPSTRQIEDEKVVATESYSYDC